MTPVVPYSSPSAGAASSRFDRDAVKDSLIGEIARRARHSQLICLAGLVLFAVLDWSVGNPHQAELAAIKLLQLVTLTVAATVLWRARRRSAILVATQCSLTALYAGAAGSGLLLGDFTTPPVLLGAIAIGGASYVPWGARAQGLSLVPAALSAAWFFWAQHDAATPFQSSTIAALAVSFLVSLFTAGQTEGQRLARIHFAAVERALRESEDRRATVIATALDAIVVVDEADAILEFNPAAERIFGFARDAAVGHPLVELLVPARFREFYPAAHADHLSSRHSSFLGVGVEIPALRVDGSEFPAEFAVARSQWEGQSILVYQIRDLTRRKLAEHALRQSEARLKSFFDSASVLLVLIELRSDDFVFALPNRRAAEFFGSTLEQFTGKTAREVGFSEEQLDFWLVHARRCIASGPRRIPAYPFKLGEHTRWLEVSLSAVRSDEQGAAQISVAAVDITERRFAEEALHALNRELESRVRQRTAQLELANRELESFSYAVSHDLRAPLRAIDGFADVLLQDHGDRLDAEATAHLQRVRQAAQRMAELIDGLLSLSRLVRGELRNEAVDLSRIATEVVAELRSRCAGRDVDVIVHPAMTTRGDPRLLRLVLENLIGNAFKYTSRRDRARIEIGQNYGEPVAEYFVRDNGCGFDPAYSDKLFRAFTRLHDDTEYEGSGIGLATVARIVRRHGGHVRAEGEDGGGAAFFFSLAVEQHDAQVETLSA